MPAKYTVSKNDTDVAHHNYAYMKGFILIIFLQMLYQENKH